MKIVEFRTKGPMNNRLPHVGAEMPGEVCLLRIDRIKCLFPVHRQIVTDDEWTLDVFKEDWEKVVGAFTRGQ